MQKISQNTQINFVDPGGQDLSGEPLGPNVFYRRQYYLISTYVCAFTNFCRVKKKRQNQVIEMATIKTSRKRKK
jgi:hypothetical protein